VNPVQQDEKKLGLKLSLVPTNNDYQSSLLKSLIALHGFRYLKEIAVWVERQLFVVVQMEGDPGD